MSRDSDPQLASAAELLRRSTGAVDLFAASVTLFWQRRLIYCSAGFFMAIYGFAAASQRILAEAGHYPFDIWPEFPPRLDLVRDGDLLLERVLVTVDIEVRGAGAVDAEAHHVAHAAVLADEAEPLHFRLGSSPLVRYLDYLPRAVKTPVSTGPRPAE
jgi:hypothetical protein